MRLPWQKRNNQTENTVDTAEQILSYKIYSFTETGPSRSNNEDNITWFHPNNNKEVLFAMVADGMGGHNAGEVASHLACSVAEHFIQTNSDKRNIPDLLHQLFEQMHKTIVDAAEQNSGYSGMGTTAAAIFVRQKQIVFSHVGDIRVYQYKNHRLQQLSTDQTLVNQMIREGKLKDTDPHTNQIKHLLLQALGTAKTIEPEIGKPIDLEIGDYYFLCSDGIYDMLSNEEIAALLSMRKPSLTMECIRALCYERNARDNFSVLLVEIKSGDPLPESTITREQNIFV